MKAIDDYLKTYITHTFVTAFQEFSESDLTVCLCPLWMQLTNPNHNFFVSWKNLSINFQILNILVIFIFPASCSDSHVDTMIVKWFFISCVINVFEKWIVWYKVCYLFVAVISKFPLD